MAEIKKIWLTHDYHGDAEEVLNADEDTQIGYFSVGIGEGGRDLQKLADFMFGTGAARFAKEKAKIFDDEASAVKDAKSRLAKWLKRNGGKTASDSMTLRVAAKFGANV